MENREPIRIWFSDQPDELCGFYCLCSEIRKLNAPICAVKLPKLVETSNGATEYAEWGDVCLEELHSFLQYQKALSAKFISVFAMKWSMLQEENVPLRVYLNGRLQSAPESFYDVWIQKEIDKTEGEFVEAMLIGQILGRNALHISDEWIAARIDHMIENKKLLVVEPAKEDELLYRRTLKRAMCPIAD